MCSRSRGRAVHDVADAAADRNHVVDAALGGEAEIGNLRRVQAREIEIAFETDQKVGRDHVVVARGEADQAPGRIAEQRIGAVGEGGKANAAVDAGVETLPIGDRPWRIIVRGRGRATRQIRGQHGRRRKDEGREQRREQGLSHYSTPLTGRARPKTWAARLLHSSIAMAHARRCDESNYNDLS